jgi:hypothetical protein
MLKTVQWYRKESDLVSGSHEGIFPPMIFVRDWALHISNLTASLTKIFEDSTVAR